MSRTSRTAHSLTCWRFGIPALGLPGKKTWGRCWETLKGLAAFKAVQVYVWQEPDAKELPREVAHNVPGALVIAAPPEFKDLSEAHCQGRDIPALVHELREGAKPPPLPLEQIAVRVEGETVIVGEEA